MKLKIENIKKSYKNNKVLDGINITFDKGIYAILGPNGVGKTTLNNIIMGLITPDDGKIIFEGKNIKEIGDEFLKHVGYMPQDLKFYKNFTALDMLKYIGILKGQTSRYAAEQAEFMLRKVNLYEDRNKKIGKFSGGMIKRLSISQALMDNPDILIFDEPTAGLDIRERIRFKNLITNLSNDKLVIICTHIVSDIDSIADYILMLKDGKIDVRMPNDVCRQLDGKMWFLETDYTELEKLTTSVRVHSVKRKGTKYILKIYSETKPSKEAVEAEANLEDVYLHYFSEDNNVFSL